MLQRTGHGLGDLIGKAGCGIVRKPVVLTILRGEFRLQKEIGPYDDGRAIDSSQSFAYSRFKVVAALVGRIDGAKPGANRKFRKRCGAVFLPGSAIEEGGRGLLRG